MAPSMGQLEGLPETLRNMGRIDFGRVQLHPVAVKVRENGRCDETVGIEMVIRGKMSNFRVAEGNEFHNDNYSDAGGE